MIPWPALVAGELLNQQALNQPGVGLPAEQPLRSLKWGDFNVLHTTDTHGWLAGHLLEPNFGADWGDFISFTHHLRQITTEYGVDLLLVDTGDRHDGNGLSDATDTDGEYSDKVFTHGDYDLVTIGNHELYQGDVALQDWKVVGGHFKDRYVVSNVEIKGPDGYEPMGQKYRNFTTQTGKRVLGMGFLFDFEGNDRERSIVTKVKDEITKPWFQHVLEHIQDFDVVVVIGHIAVRGQPEFDILHQALRAAHPSIPIHMHGGHAHVRDFRIFDKKAAALAAGRYCETVGWASATESGDELEFGRAYIDFNKRSFAFHGNVSLSDFGTDHGKSVSKNLASIRKTLKLDTPRACVPQTYYTDRAVFPGKSSIFSLLQDEVLQLLEGTDTDRADEPTYILLNTGAIRFDLFAGLYSLDSGYIVSPFRNKWLYIKDIPRFVADQVLPIINSKDHVLAAHSRISTQVAELHELKTKHTPGYKTLDDLGKDGDDTEHVPWVFYPIPNALQATRHVKRKTSHVDMIFHDFMGPYVHEALTLLGEGDLYTPAKYGGEHLTELIAKHFASTPAQLCR